MNIGQERNIVCFWSSFGVPLSRRLFRQCYSLHYGVNSGQLARCRVYGPRTRNRGLNLVPTARFTHKLALTSGVFSTNTEKNQSSLVGGFLNLASDYPVHPPDHFGTKYV